MTFEEFTAKRIADGQFTPRGDNWDPAHPVCKVPRPTFARVVGPSRGSGRIVVITQSLGDKLHEARTLTGRSLVKIFHEIELDFSRS